MVGSHVTSIMEPPTAVPGPLTATSGRAGWGSGSGSAAGSGSGSGSGSAAATAVLTLDIAAFNSSAFEAWI